MAGAPGPARRRAARWLRGGSRRARVAYYRAISTGTFTGPEPRIVAPVLVLGPGVVSAEGATLGNWPSPDLLDGYVHVQTSAAATTITIGAGSVLNNGTKLLAEGPGIAIGRDVLVGRNTEIYDSDRHDLDPTRRRGGQPLTGLVVIEDNVFIGSGVMIAKGVRIGRDSVVGMGSVVTRDIPAGVVAAGNPCRVLRDLSDPGPR